MWQRGLLQQFAYKLNACSLTTVSEYQPAASSVRKSCEAASTGHAYACDVSMTPASEAGESKANVFISYSRKDMPLPVLATNSRHSNSAICFLMDGVASIFDNSEN
jgi:hypothetical protein